MNRRTAAVAAAVALLALSFAPAGAAKKRTVTISKDYLPPNGIYGMCEIEPIVPGVGPAPWGVNIGAVCVQVPRGKTEGRIKDIVDTTSANVGYSWYWLDKDWVEVGHVGLHEDPEAWLLTSGSNHGGGCDRADAGGATTRWLKAPKGAKFFYVHIHAYGLSGLLNCSESDGASTGTVTLQFR